MVMLDGQRIFVDWLFEGAASTFKATAKPVGSCSPL